MTTVDTSEDALTAPEVALCEFHDAILAAARREELRAHYAVAVRVRDLRISTLEGLRESLLRCGLRLGRNRTTLLRYGTVAQRIKPAEFQMLLALGDERGYPITFWDLVEVVGLGADERARQLVEKLRVRRTAPRR